MKHRGILLTLKGTVIRSGSVKMIEGEKIYECRTCKHRYSSSPDDSIMPCFEILKFHCQITLKLQLSPA